MEINLKLNYFYAIYFDEKADRWLSNLLFTGNEKPDYFSEQRFRRGYNM